MDSTSERKGGPHIKENRRSVFFDADLHAELKEYAKGKKKKDEKKVTARMIVEDSLAKTIKFDMFGETWEDIDIDPRAREVLLKYSQTHGNMPQAMILSSWIMELVNFDIRDSDWAEELAESRAREKEREKSREPFAKKCHKRAVGYDKDEKEVSFCVAYNEAGVVKTRVLGKTRSVVNAKCLACDLDREMREGLIVRDTRIRELEDKIQMKAKTSRKVPVCNKGAILCQEGTAFKACPKSSIPVSVATYCKVLSGGLPCALYAEIELAEGPL